MPSRFLGYLSGSVTTGMLILGLALRTINNGLGVGVGLIGEGLGLGLVGLGLGQC